MTSSFPIVKADGSSFDIYALEGDGSTNVSMPREVLQAITDGGAGVNYFELGDDLTYRFIPGFQFEIIDVAPLTQPFPANSSSINQPITAVNTVAEQFQIAGDFTAYLIPGTAFTVYGSTGNNGTWVVSIAVFALGFTTITVTGDVTNAVANGFVYLNLGTTYTVAPGGSVFTGSITQIPVVEVIPRGYFSVVNVILGGPTWVISGNHAVEFGAGTNFTVSGDSTTGNGQYNVVSATNVGPNTNLVVTPSIPATPAADGRVSVNSYNIVGVTTGAPGIAKWVVAGNVADRLPVGAGFLVSGNAGGGTVNIIYSVTSATNVGPNTEIITSGPIVPAATISGQVLVGVIPFGFVQYHVPAADGGLNTSFDLLGKGMLNWGQSFQQNLVRDLNHFANTTPPPAPMPGQLWYDTGTPALNLFASNIYNVTAVDTVGPVYSWTIASPPLVDLTLVFTSGLAFAVYGNTGLDEANIAVPGTYPATVTYQVLSSSNTGVGTPTTIIIDTTVSAPLQASIPGIATASGQLYAMTDWHALALKDDVFVLDWKASVRAATTAVLPAYTYNNGINGVGATITATANGALTLDTITPFLVNDRVLIKNETFVNGIYTVTQPGSGGTPFILTRATDADNNIKITSGMATFVEEGTQNTDTAWFLITDTPDPFVIGTTSLVFAQFPAIAQPLNQIVYGTGTGITSELEFTWNPTTNVLQAGTVGIPATIQSPDGSASAGANLSVITGTGVGTNQAGGILALTAGAATGTGTGGNVNITAGTSPSGTNGVVLLTGGNGDVIQVGASINITGVTAAIGSPITITAGASTSAVGGNVSITAGDGATIGGSISALGGNSTGTNAGGEIYLSAGYNVTDTGDGGQAVLVSGNGGAITGNGGTVGLAAGGTLTGSGRGGIVGIDGGVGMIDYGGDNTAGGTASLRGGNAVDLGTGGNVYVTSGAGGASGTYGSGPSGNVNISSAPVANGTSGSVNITTSPGAGVATSGYQIVDVGGGKTGASLTGLANDATVYTADIVVDGVTIPITVTGSAAQTYTTLLSEINTDLGVSATASLYPVAAGQILVMSATTGPTSTVVITDTGTPLFSSLTGYLSLLASFVGQNPDAGNVIIAPGVAPGGIAGSFRVTTDATDRLEIGAAGGWNIGGSEGNSKQVLTSNGSGTPPTWADEPYDIATAASGAPTASFIVLNFVSPRSFDLVANFSGSQAVAITAATASTVFTVKKNGVAITSGTITFAAAGTVGTFGAIATTSFVAGDVITIVAPVTPDATLANIAFTLVCILT